MSNSIMNDGGKRIEYGDGMAVREPSDGKGRFDLVSPFALARLAKWYELGAIKYSDRNWEKGIPFSRYLDSAMRHLNKFAIGMDDEDHLAAAAWNIFAMMHHQELGQKDFDDLPHYKGFGNPYLKTKGYNLKYGAHAAIDDFSKVIQDYVDRNVYGMNQLNGCDQYPCRKEDKGDK